MGFEFINKFKEEKPTVYVPNPTWGNHHTCITSSGLKFVPYRYYDPTTKLLDFPGMIEDLSKIPKGSVVLLHACAHNPTGNHFSICFHFNMRVGVDLTEKEWLQLQDMLLKKDPIVFFDMAYQGFATGDPIKDSFAVRSFAKTGCNMLLAQSFAKNFGLYGERAGCLSMLCKRYDYSIVLHLMQYLQH